MLLCRVPLIMYKTNVPRLPAIKLHTKRWRKQGSIICLFIILLVCGTSTCYSQLTNTLSDSAIAQRQVILGPSINLTGISALSRIRAKPTMLPQSFYTQTIGYFCKKEIQIEKAVKMPLRIRLGSVAYTDKMENKNSFKITQQ